MRLGLDETLAAPNPAGFSVRHHGGVTTSAAQAEVIADLNQGTLSGLRANRLRMRTLDQADESACARSCNGVRPRVGGRRGLGPG
jgi:hypothetical protein